MSQVQVQSEFKIKSLEFLKNKGKSLEKKNIANAEKVWAHCKILPHSIEDMAVDKCVQTPTMPGLIDKQIRYPRLCELELFTEKCMC